MKIQNLKDIFWKQYLKENELDRLKSLESPAIFIDGYRKIKDDKLRLHGIRTALQSYFDDLIEFMDNKKCLKDGKNEKGEK